VTTKRKVTIGSIVIYLAAVILLSPYLAGCLYFLANKTLPHDVGLGTWLTYWQSYSSDPVQSKRLEFAMGATIFILLGIPLLIVNAIFNKQRSLHGDARFMTTSEVRGKGLLGSQGVIVGKMGGAYLHMDGKAPILLAAPTRQGKGAGVVIPNLLNYPDSMVVLDTKMENFQITSRYRQAHGQKVFLFNPFAEDGRTHRWNPMDAIRRDPNLRVVDATSIGEMLYPRTSDDSGMWNDLARDLFIGFVLYLIETPTLPCTFGEVLRQMSGKGRGLKEHVQQIMAQRNRGEDALSDACYEAFGRFCSAEERQVSSIKITATAPLLIFQNAYVDAATSVTDFDVARVRKQRVTIYVGIPADMMMTAGLIVNLFFSHLIKQNMKELPAQNPDLKYQCLVLLDEFTILGKVGIIPKSIGLISGFNMRLVFIIQGVSQLISIYGEHDARTMEDNCDVQVLYPPRNQKDANEYSEMLGAYTAKAMSVGVSRPRAFGNSNNGSASENVSDQRRLLMLPQELRELPWTNEVVIAGNMKPILCDKALYFADSHFIGLLKAISPRLAAVRGLPSEKDLTTAALTYRELSTELPVHNVNLHVAKMERRRRFLRPGEAPDSEALAISPDLIPPVTPDNPEATRASVNSFIEALSGVYGTIDADGVLSAPGPGAEETDQDGDDLPVREPDGIDWAALKRAAGRLPVDPDVVPKRATAAVMGKVVGPLAKRLGVLNLDRLKKSERPPLAASG
jgi:type IV secretion system protein VirD4